MKDLNNYLDKFIKFICCPICNGDLNIHNQNFLICKKCESKYKIHSNKILKLFTPDNIYPTKKKINWENIS